MAGHLFSLVKKCINICIARAQESNGDKYELSLVDYLKSKSASTIFKVNNLFVFGFFNV